MLPGNLHTHSLLSSQHARRTFWAGSLSQPGIQKFTVDFREREGVDTVYSSYQAMRDYRVDVIAQHL